MDLARPPLFSAAFIHRKEGWALGLDMHHLISDGLTTPLLLSHLDQLYQGRVCSSPALTYKDAAWAMQDGPAEADLAYWKKTLTPLPKPLLLPQDRREQPHQGGSQLIYDLSLEGSEKIRTFCAAKQLTPAALFAWCGADSAGPLEPERPGRCRNAGQRPDAGGDAGDAGVIHAYAAVGASA